MILTSAAISRPSELGKPVPAEPHHYWRRGVPIDRFNIVTPPSPPPPPPLVSVDRSNVKKSVRYVDKAGSKGGAYSAS